MDANANKLYDRAHILLNNQTDAIYDHVRKLTTLSIIFWTLCLSDLALNALYRNIVGILIYCRYN